MKPLLFILTTVILLCGLTGCRQEQKAQTPANTFRTQTATQPAAEVSLQTEVVNLLKQKVARGVSEILLTRKAYTTSYNKQRRTPNWVAWTLTKEHTRGNLLRDNERFEEDTDVAEPRATWQDYYNSRYDRGHMCPAGDNKWNEEAMSQTFKLTNICPQNHGLNKNGWNDLEIQCRDWAREYNAVDIVCGPIYRTATYSDGKMRPSNDQKFIGKNKVWVPDAFFKVVLCRGKQPKAIGFIYENRGGQQLMRECMCSVDEVERITGINFYHLLADDIEDRIEAEANLRKW